MTTFVIAVLTVILVLNCLFLILLVLVQLPKKEAGIGMAFGGAATETLFGAGSGTVLTRATKYSAGIFMVLSLVLAILNSTVSRRAGAVLEDELQRLASPGAAPTAITAPTVTNVPAPAPITPLPAPTQATQAVDESATLLLSSTNVTPAPVAAPVEQGTNQAPE